MSSAPRSELLSICIPTYNAALFIEETLYSLYTQSHRNLEVIVSDDASRDGTLRALSNFQKRHPDFPLSVLSQKKRLGWVENINVLFDRAKAEYLCLLAHDDVLEVDYLEKLLNALIAAPHAVQSYCDIRTIGELQGMALSQNPLFGTVLERAESFLLEHHKAVSFRGLIRRSLAGSKVFVPQCDFANFSADSLQMLQLALSGALIRVPECLYKKRYHAASTHRIWSEWSREQCIEAWLSHCIYCCRILRRERFSESDWQRLSLALERRVLQDDLHLWRPEIFRGCSDVERHYLWTRLHEEIARNVTGENLHKGARLYA